MCTNCVHNDSFCILKNQIRGDKERNCYMYSAKNEKQNILARKEVRKMETTKSGRKTRASLTVEKQSELYDMKNGGMTFDELAEIYGIANSTAHRYYHAEKVKRDKNETKIAVIPETTEITVEKSAKIEISREAKELCVYKFAYANPQKMEEDWKYLSSRLKKEIPDSLIDMLYDYVKGTNI